MKRCLSKLANVKPSHLTKLGGSIFGRPNIAAFSSQAQDIPEKCDVCIIGGGGMGSSAAFWLKREAEGRNLKVVVVERDNKYTTASTVLSMGGVRQQFSLGENVQLSLFGAEFIRNLPEYLDVKPDDINFKKGGYLFIATTPEGAKILHENHVVQREYGSKIELLTNDAMRKRYPRVNSEDIELASLGVENEGWFDPWSLLNTLKKKAISLGVQYVNGEVVGFDSGRPSANLGPTSVQIRNEDGKLRNIQFSQCVLATGYESGKVAALAGIGTGAGALRVPMPVEPRKRYVYYIHAPELADDDNIPYVLEPNGVYNRPDCNGYFLAGRSPEEDNEPSCENLEVDYSFFETHIWPTIAHRVPEFENVKIKSAWGGYYDYNAFDQNGIIGTHPVFRNIHFITGFSGHGIQQAPAAGRAIMEIILKGGFRTIDLTRFGFERVIRQEQVLERNII